MNKPLFPLLLLCLLLSALPVPGRTQLVFGPGPEGPGNALDAIVAVVNDDVITRRELDAAIAQIERQLREKKVPIPPGPVLENQVLERLILMQLQLRAAERNGISVDDATLNAAIENLARRNNMNLTQLRQTVEKDGVSFAKFRDDVRRELMAARLRQKLVDSQIQVAEQDVESLQAQLAGEKNFGGGAGGEREYHIAQILIAVPDGATPQQIEAARRRAGDVLAQLRKGVDFRQLAVSVSASQQALEGGDLGWRRADQLPTLFADAVPKLRPGQFSDLIRSPSGFHIVKLLEIRGGSSEASSPTAKPALVTQTRARHILLGSSPELSDDQARQKLEQWRQQVRNGEDFAALARDNSDDKGSAARGGDLGWVVPGMLAPEFDQEMNRLQPNEISAPFKTPFGWHIVQVLERRQGQAPPEAERVRIREALLRRRSDAEWELLLRRLRDEAYVEVRLAPVSGMPEAEAPATRAP
jgi:peptidyl-prolyl cis-trans isomerase SurA